ncbi:MAG: glycoside hydrolase family 127 protein, partial [Planctomycetes bacterium]|nr:glycoside hydrolase family 127 protein [Planctomycetota bacterium]
MSDERPARDYGVTKTSASPCCKLRSVDLRSVRWTSGFWAERFKQCAEVTLPHQWALLSDPQKGHALTNLRIAAGLETGEFKGTHWQDEWVYKWLEAASVVWAMTADAELERRMDEAIDAISKAQQPDGYIATQITVRGWKRFQHISHHELYVMGHLLTAACLHHRLTGKTSFLDVAKKVGDFLHKTFMPRDPAFVHFDVNPSYIMGAVELYRTTGDRRYLDLANVFISNRGSQPRPPQSAVGGDAFGGTDLNQDRVPLRQETEVVGHAVFFTYLYAGAADAYMETGDKTLLDAVERLWHDLTERKMYVTGGVCPVHKGLSLRWIPPRPVGGGSSELVGAWTKSSDDVHEAAGAEFDLPSATAYNETCSQIGNLMWNWRMLAINGEARHADMM